VARAYPAGTPGDSRSPNAHRRQFRVDRIPHAIGPEEIGGPLLEALRHILTRVAARFARVHVTLTAGLDTRTLLAAGVAARVRLETVTLEHPRSSLADRVLPPRLAAIAGVEHRFVPTGTWSTEREATWDAHTFRLELEDVVKAPARLARRFWDFASVRLEAEQLSDWVTWRARHGSAFDWMDAFHVDQRLRGWAAACEQGLDLLAATSINPANCGFILGLISRGDAAARAGGHELAAIRLPGTGLDALPVNPRLEHPLARAAARGRRAALRAAREGANALGI
jgi:hypothetical protein